MHSRVTLSSQAAGKPLLHYWQTCVGAGRANEGLRANWQEQLQLVVSACGFRYIRFHGLFHDDMFVCRKIQDEYRYNWQYIDELFDRLLTIGIRPFVELGFCPLDLASGGQTIFWWQGHISPPDDYTRWVDLVAAAAQHWIARYGLNEVRNWYFEVWNEPNLSAFWAGTQSHYFELYRVTSLALKAVDPYLRVGGPATSNYLPNKDSVPAYNGVTRNFTAQELRHEAVEWEAVWIKDFLAFCQREQLPVNFVSTHPYPTDIALDLKGLAETFIRDKNATIKDLEYIRKLVEESAYPEAEIHLTEWNSSPSPRDFAHDSLPAATFVVKTNLEATGLVDSLSYWTFTDIFEENGAGNSIFHGGFGMVNFQGIVKPTFHAYRFLHTLGNEELYREPGCIVTRQTQTGALSILLYHYPDELASAVPTAPTLADAECVLHTGTARELHLEIVDLAPGTEFLVETLDEHHGFALSTWEVMGRPENITREQTVDLKACAWNTDKASIQVDAQGVLSLDLHVKPWSIILISVR